MAFNSIIGAVSATLLVSSFNANAMLVGFEFSGLSNESTLNIPWGSFAGGRIIYDTQRVESTANGAFNFRTDPVEFTFEIYKNANKEILYALEAGQVDGTEPDFTVQVNNRNGNSSPDTLQYKGRNAMSLATRNGQTINTEFHLSLQGIGALSNSLLPEYVPDLSLFSNTTPQIAAWAADDVNGFSHHLFTVRELVFTPINPNELSAVPLPSSLLLMFSGMIALIGLQRKKSGCL